MTVRVSRSVRAPKWGEGGIPQCLCETSRNSYITRYVEITRWGRLPSPISKAFTAQVSRTRLSTFKRTQVYNDPQETGSFKTREATLTSIQIYMGNRKNSNMSFRKFSCVYWARRFTTVTTKVYYLTVSQPFETTNVTHYLNVQLQPCTSFPRKNSAYICYLNRNKMHEILWEKRQRPPTFSDMKTVHNLKKRTQLSLYTTRKHKAGVKVYLRSFLTSPLGGGVDLTTRPLYIGERAPSPCWIGAGWAAKPVWTFWKSGEILPLPGFEPQITQLVAITAMNYAIPATRAYRKATYSDQHTSAVEVPSRGKMLHS